MDETKMIMMVGLSGSNQRAVADKLFEGMVYQSVSGRKVSEICNFLEKGQSVLIYGYHLTIRDRAKIMRVVADIPCKKIACVVAVPVAKCIENRNAVIESEDEVRKKICKQRESFQFPLRQEGFNQITIYHSDQPDMGYEEMIGRMNGFNQYTHYHREKMLDIHNHNVVTLMNPKEKVLKEACMLHDYGKLYTQRFKENGEAHYYNHANVGAYEVMTHYQNHWDQDSFQHMLFLVNYHMEPFFWGKKATRLKKKKFFGDSAYDLLIRFNQADIKACDLLE